MSPKIPPQPDRAVSQASNEGDREGLASPTVSRPETVQPSTDALFRLLGEEAVILDLRTQRYFGLDSVGARIWQLLVEHGCLETVVGALVGEYEVGEAEARQDVSALVERLMGHGLLEPGPAAL